MACKSCTYSKKVTANSELIMLPQNDAPALLEEMRSQNLLSMLQLLVADPAEEPEDSSSDAHLYNRMHEILDKVTPLCHMTP